MSSYLKFLFDRIVKSLIIVSEALKVAVGVIHQFVSYNNDTWGKNFQYGYYLIFLPFLYNLCKSFIYRHAHIRGRYIHGFQLFLVSFIQPDAVVFCISTHCFG